MDTSVLYVDFTPGFSHDLDSFAIYDYVIPVVDHNISNQPEVLKGTVPTTPVVYTDVENNHGSHCFSSFKNDFYYRIHITPANLDLGNLLSDQIQNVEVWNAHEVSNNLSIINNLNDAGLILTEPTPAPTMFNALESRIYNVNISTNGPATIDAQYTFNFATENAILKVTGRRVTLWPYMPQTEYLESLQWLTDIIQTRKTEQRLCLRQNPRQTFNYKYQLTSDQFARAKLIAEEWSHRVFGVPVWGELQGLGGLVPGASFITVNTTLSDYRDNDVVLLFESDSNFEILETTTITPTTINLKLPIAGAYSDAFVMPLRFGRALRGFSFQRIPFDVTNSNVEFTITNSVDLSQSPFPQFKSKDVVTDRSILQASLNERIYRDNIISDTNTGIISTYANKDFSRHEQQLAIDAQDETELFRVRQWLHSQRGRQKSFWLPTWHTDVDIIADVGAASLALTVTKMNYTLYKTTSHIMIQLKNGQQFFNKITGSSENVGDETLFLEIDFGTAFTVSEIELCCFIELSRFNADRIELQHTFGNNTSVRIPILSVDQDEYI